MTDRPTGRRLIALAAAVTGLATAPGCRTYESMKAAVADIHLTSSYDDPRADERMAEADRLFEAGRYGDALDAYKKLADNTGNTADLAERARFLQAECRRLRGEYPKAVDTYNRLLKDFPTGAHRREACNRIFEICDYWLDDFRDELTARGTKGEKGILYWRPRWPNPFDKTKPDWVQEDRALEALERVHTHDITGPAADQALFWCGYVNFVRGNFDEADHFFSQLVELHKDSKLRPQAIAFAIQAKNNATGGAVYDGRKCAEALHLVHVAEASVPELTGNPEMADRLTRSKFAIRYQQAEKDFRTAEYYQRTGHPGSAVFYYELVRRRYAGTRYADQATERKDALMAQMAAGKTPPGADPFAHVKAKWDEVFGREEAPAADAPDRPADSGPPPGPAPLPAGVGGPGS
ncbi:MAG: tetratricopeptide repeat protein [Gemmataceae bacterium]|nr:tetratricopeptide repeat protein [Gemmataceae bacterium]